MPKFTSYSYSLDADFNNNTEHSHKLKSTHIITIIAIVAVTIMAVVAIVMCMQKDQNTYDVTNYGAVGDGNADDTAAVQRAIDECSNAGGGQVTLPENKTFMTGPVELKSNVDFHLCTNSKIIANPDESIYQLSAFRDNRGEGMMWLYANDVTNLSITGNGSIDGNGVAFMGAELEDSYELKKLEDSNFDPRPHVLTLENVENLDIRDVTIEQGAYWTVHLIGCYDARITGISLKNNLKIRNGDGIDVDHSKKVRISDCFIESGDDCICLKNRREFEEYGACEDIVVSNCVMTGRSCAIKLGSENMDSINNVLVNNCVITKSNRGIGIQNRDEGTVTNVRFSNITLDCNYYSDVWWGKAEPIYVTSYPRALGNNKDAGWRFPKGATEGKCGQVSDIFFDNIRGISENGCFVGGDTQDKVKNIYFTDVNLTLRKVTNYPGGQYDARPRVGEGFISSKAYGIYVEQATNVIARNLDVSADSSFDATLYGGEKFGF